MSVEALETMDLLVKRLRRRREELGMSYQAPRSTRVFFLCENI